VITSPRHSNAHAVLACILLCGCGSTPGLVGLPDAATEAPTDATAPLDAQPIEGADAPVRPDARDPREDTGVTMNDGGTMDGSDDGAASQLDALPAEASATDAGVSDTTTAEPDVGAADTGASTPDAPGDAPTVTDASSSPDADADARTLGEAGQEVLACEACLQTSCASALATCQADPQCAVTVQCVITSQCFSSSDAGTLTSCTDTCETTEGLTLGEKVTVTADILAMDVCDLPCAATCALPDGG